MSDCVIEVDNYWTAHVRIRKAWIARFGPLGSDDHLCHLCPNGNCTNLRHVYPGNAATNAQDTLRMGRHASQRITHCPHGHEMTAENTITDPKRRCRTCRNEYKARLARERRRR